MRDDYKTGDLVAVINGTLDAAGLVDMSASFGNVLHVGQSDLFVELDVSSRSKVVVPKDICVLVKASAKDLRSAEVEKPGVGDLILYNGKPSWRDQEEKVVIGIVYELEYRHGVPTRITVMSESEMVKLPYTNILVLQKKVK